jgi:hypothetical protein
MVALALAFFGLFGRPGVTVLGVLTRRSLVLGHLADVTVATLLTTTLVTVTPISPLAHRTRDRLRLVTTTVGVARLHFCHAVIATTTTIAGSFCDRVVAVTLATTALLVARGPLAPLLHAVNARATLAIGIDGVLIALSHLLERTNAVLATMVTIGFDGAEAVLDTLARA